MDSIVVAYINRNFSMLGNFQNFSMVDLSVGGNKKWPFILFLVFFDILCICISTVGILED